MAIDDGPGIRTTIFFNGCPLKCIWCATEDGVIIWDIKTDKKIKEAKPLNNE